MTEPEAIKAMQEMGWSQRQVDKTLRLMRQGYTSINIEAHLDKSSLMHQTVR